jgi:hypothetical protein
MAHEYYALRRDEELLKLKRRLQEPDLTSPAASETDIVQPLIPILSTTPNTRYSQIDVGDNLVVDVDAADDEIDEGEWDEKVSDR